MRLGDALEKHFFVKQRQVKGQNENNQQYQNYGREAPHQDTFL
jgi:hypothetical protein